MLAYPSDVKSLIPPASTIPAEFWRPSGTWDDALFNGLFFGGCANVRFYPARGIDAELAYRHVTAIMRSWEPKHEHKQAACRYLFTQWFDKVEWDTVPVTPDG